MYTVRHIKKDELDKLVELYGHMHNQDEPVDPVALKKSWSIICNNPDFFIYFVIEDKEKLVCSCTLTLVPNLTRGSRMYGVVENVVTHPDYRRQGLASKILEHALYYAREHNCYKVMLLSSAERTEGHKLYEKLGFSSTAKKGFLIKF